MKSGRNTLLAGVAALALVAGAGLTSAQAAENEQDHKGATTVKEPSAAASPKASPKSGAAAQAPQTSTNRNAQDERKDERSNAPGGRNAAEAKPSQQGPVARDDAKKSEKSGEKSGATAEEHDRAGAAAQDRTRGNAAANRENREDNGKAGQRTEERGGANGANSAARERGNDERLRGLQGNASGTNRQFSEQQRTEIRNTVIDASGAPRVDHVDFDVTIGTAVPRGGITIMPVPETLVAIDPEWRGFRYFVYEEEVVIVDPATMQIVAVVVI